MARIALTQSIGHSFLRATTIIVASVVLVTATPPAFAIVIEGVEFPLGDLSFADFVADYDPGQGVGSPYNVPGNSLGSPTLMTNPLSVSLGDEGSIVLQFTDNVLVDQNAIEGGNDLFIWESGSAHENFKAEISIDGQTFIDLGTFVARPTAIDIGAPQFADRINPGDEFRFVRITDDSTGPTAAPFAGADISAVGAIGSGVTPDFHIYDYSAGGFWHDSNWNEVGFPNGNTKNAIFGTAISIPSTVTLDSDIKVKTVTFDSPLSYNVAGLGTLTFEADLGNSTIAANQGTHQFQANVSLANDTDVDVKNTVTLSFNNRLDIGGQTLTKTGLGTLEINNNLVSAGGSVVGLAGSIAGGGTIGGNVNNISAVVSPGNSAGVLGVDGDYTQALSGILEIEIGGKTQGEEFDLLSVRDDVALAGTLNVVLADSFVPALGDRFEVITAASIVGTFDTVNVPSLPGMLSWFIDYTETGVDLVSTIGADFDLDGDVDGYDFIKWQRGESPAPLIPGDLALWESQFGTIVPVVAEAVSTPEPSTLLLASIAGCASLQLRRRISVLRRAKPPLATAIGPTSTADTSTSGLCSIVCSAGAAERIYSRKLSGD